MSTVHILLLQVRREAVQLRKVALCEDTLMGYLSFSFIIYEGWRHTMCLFYLQKYWNTMIIREGLQQQVLPKSWNCQNWSLFWGTILFLGANLSLSWVNYHFSLAFVHFINQIHQKIFAWVRHPLPPPSGNARILEVPVAANPLLVCSNIVDKMSLIYCHLPIILCTHVSLFRY